METNSNKKNILHITSKVTVGNNAGGTRSHDKLANLDYASSGHIGFASSEELTNVAAQVLSDAKQYTDESIEKISPQDYSAFINEHNNSSEAHPDIREIIGGKVDKVVGKDLSTNDLTDDLLTKINNLNNYDDSDLRTQIRLIQMILTSNDTNLDTLQELVSALKNNTANIGDIFTALANKVDKEEGKGLSTHDLTDELLEKINTSGSGSGSYDDTLIKEEIEAIKLVLTSDTESLDTLQELVNALQKNPASIENIFASLANKVDKDFYKAGTGISIAADGTISINLDAAEGGSF